MYTVSITLDNVIDALADFLQPFCGQAEIIRAQVNRVNMPKNEFVVLTELLQVELETPTQSLDDLTGNAKFKNSVRLDIQVDFYGANAGDYCRAVANVLRTDYACSQFAAGIKPLYASDGVQSPLIDGEQQWHSRWMLTISLQYNPELTITAQSAAALAYTINKAVDIPAPDAPPVDSFRVLDGSNFVVNGASQVINF